MGIASRLNEKYGPSGRGMKPDERRVMDFLASFSDKPGPAPEPEPFTLQEEPPKKKRKKKGE